MPQGELIHFKPFSSSVRPAAAVVIVLWHLQPISCSSFKLLPLLPLIIQTDTVIFLHQLSVCDDGKRLIPRKQLTSPSNERLTYIARSDVINLFATF